MRSPFIRLPLALLFVVPVFLAQSSVWLLRDRLGPIPVALLSAFIACVAGIAVYALYTRWVERRPAREFGRAGALKELGAGLLIGAALFSACVGVLALLGHYRISGTRGLSIIVVPLCLSLASGTIEEIMMRGVLFRLLEESLGTWIALAISALTFGLLHLANPGATPQAAVAIAFEAGIMLAAAYVLTRRLWLAIGIHAAWNFTQSGIFSVPVSGFPIKGLFISETSGPAWLTGGEFGIEASVIAFVVCTAAGIALLVLAHRRGHFIAPYWRRDRSAVVSATGTASA
ncbi:MAG: type II CAAX endopeptidase family protein [Burkholderiales bacterium]